MSYTCPFHPLLLSLNEVPLTTYLLSPSSSTEINVDDLSPSQITITSHSLVITANAFPSQPTPHPTQTLLKVPFKSISGITNTDSTHQISDNHLTLHNVTSYTRLHPQLSLSNPVLPHKTFPCSIPLVITLCLPHTDTSSSSPLHSALQSLLTTPSTTLLPPPPLPTTLLRSRVLKSPKSKLLLRSPASLVLPLHTTPNLTFLLTPTDLYIVPPDAAPKETRVVPLKNIRRMAYRYEGGGMRDTGEISLLRRELRVYNELVNVDFATAEKRCPALSASLAPASQMCAFKSLLTPHAHPARAPPALEIYYSNSTSRGYKSGLYKGPNPFLTDAASSLLVSFPTPRVRDDVARYLRRFCHCDTDTTRVTRLYKAWINAEIGCWEVRGETAPRSLRGARNLRALRTFSDGTASPPDQLTSRPSPPLLYFLRSTCVC